MEVTFSNFNFLSLEQQKIIFLMYNNGQRINYKQQVIFRSEIAFNRSMRILSEVDVVKEVRNENYYPEFILLKNGIMLVEEGIIPLSEKK